MADLITPNGHEMKYLDGDPAGLANEVARMKNVATTIDQLTDLLGRIKSGHSSQSQKIDKIRDAAGDAKNALAEARDLYNKTGWALGEYQSQLQTSVTNAKTAYDSATAHLPTVNTAQTAYDTTEARYNALLNGTPVPDTSLTPEQQQAKATDDLEEARTNMVNARTTLKTHNDTLDTYKRNWDTAKNDLDTAAETARGRINNAVDSSPAKDSTWDNIAGVLDALADILGWVILVCVIVAIVVSGPIGLIALAVGTALTAVNLILHSTLAIGGKGSWLDVGLDLIGLIPFGKLFTTSGGLLARLGATGRGAIGNFNFANIVRAPGLVNAAITQNALSRSGRFWQTWADNAAGVVDNASGNFFTRLGANGSVTHAQYIEILEGLPGRNEPARQAINAAMEVVGGSTRADGVHFAVSQAASDVKLGSDVYTGSDWVTSSAVDLFTPDPSSSELKSRILAPTTVGSAPASDNPYD